MTNILTVSASNFIADNYTEYALVTAGRAIPSAIDGLKQVQRRIIQGAFDQNLSASGQYKKVSKLEGHVLGTYHPQGAASGAIINLGNASDYLQPLLQCHGNLGGWSTTTRQKISNDNPAAARYLECKLSAFAEVLFDIDRKYLATKPNYDGTTTEIVEYVPALPLALLNSQSGIGTGYTTRTVGFPVKNIIKALTTRNAESLGVPDFPFNTNIIKNEELVRLHEEGSASISLQGEWHVEQYNTGGKRNADREALIITKIAEGSAESFLNQVKEAYENGKIEGIANLIDQTSKEIRVVIVCKKDIKAESLVSSLLKYTSLSSKYSVKFTVIDSSIRALPLNYTPIQILEAWLSKRKEVLFTKYSDDLAQAQNTLLLKEGLYKIFPNLKNIALLIMEAETVDDAREALIAKYKCTTEVAELILQIQLKKLTKLSKSQLELEILSLKELIVELQKLTTDDKYLHSKIIELAKLAAKHCCQRVSPVITAIPQKPLVKNNNKSKVRNPGGISTIAYNKAKKKYFDKVAYTYCKSIKELNQALESNRHEHEDILIKDVIKKSVVKKKNGRLCKPLTEREIIRAMKNGIKSSARLKEHTDYWSNK